MRPKPLPVVNYRKCMWGINRKIKCFLLLSRKKTVRWCKKLFFHMVEIFVINAHALHTKYSRNTRKENNKHNVLQQILNTLYKNSRQHCESKKYLTKGANYRVQKEKERIWSVNVPIILKMPNCFELLQNLSPMITVFSFTCVQFSCIPYVNFILIMKKLNVLR